LLECKREQANKPGQESQMSRSETIALNSTSRAAAAWVPAGYDGPVHYSAVLGAAIPALAILLVAAAFLVQSF
jgi:hypothetical protein